MRRAALAVVALGALAGSASAEVPPAPAGAAPPSKKAAWLASKASTPRPTDAERAAADARLRKRLGKPAEAVVNVINTWTDEILPLPATGKAPAIAPEVVDRFLRCHFTNEPARMDVRLFPTVIEAARHFRATRVEIVSGFRAPKYNLMLRKKGHEVARDSQHTQGHAVDFRLRGVAVEKLRAWALRRRMGGVGEYKGSGFVHVDVGPVRQWSGD
jgi:hypothetical protein